jgi:BirA family transcriptional regulator, biotin operon repressor / biotin---[acetyl-CoA-carboxylase] ligase
MKERILAALREEKGVVSGEVLSGRLGVSRVAVWKHIQKLRDAGYDIRSTAKGYRLHASPDIPYAWEFPGRTPGVRYVERTSSTMDLARDLARKGAPGFTVVVAGI